MQLKIVHLIKDLGRVTSMCEELMHENQILKAQVKMQSDVHSRDIYKYQKEFINLSKQYDHQQILIQNLLS